MRFSQGRYDSAGVTVPFFATFDEAYRWFMDGGRLVTTADARDDQTDGRAQYLAFHAPLDAAATSQAMAALEQCDGVDGLEPSLPEHLHITLAPLGFQVLKPRRNDEVLREDVARFGSAAARVLKGVRPVEASLGPVNVFPNALVLEVHDAAGGIGALRQCLMQASDRTGAAEAAPFLPHVTLATFADTGVAAPLQELLPSLRQRSPDAIRLRRVELGRWWFTGFDERASVDLDIVRSYVLR